MKPLRGIHETLGKAFIGFGGLHAAAARAYRYGLRDATRAHGAVDQIQTLNLPSPLRAGMRGGADHRQRRFQPRLMKS